MSVFRVLLCIILPPLAVIDKGCGSLLIVCILTLLGWIPGMIGALVIISGAQNNGGGNNPQPPRS
ncbi:MAG: YqaE/Pmp3 family membrane protein [Opitutae bacterium]|nr:YqaE/Pmp3 family membrane protein [Opitutae bacterium]